MCVCWGCMISSFPFRAGKCLTSLRRKEGKDSTAPPWPGPSPTRSRQPSLVRPRPLQLPPSSLGPGPRDSQGLEATEAAEGAPVHRFQLVPRQHQLLHAGCTVKCALPHLLDPVVTQISGGRDRTGQDSGREQPALQPRGDSGVPPGLRTGWGRLHLELPDLRSSAPVPQEAGSPDPHGVGGEVTFVKQTV